MDVILAVLVCVVTTGITYLGLHTSLHPVQTDFGKFGIKVAFIGLGFVICVLAVVQAVRNDRAQKALTTTVNRIETNTKQPPHVTVNVPEVKIPPSRGNQKPARLQVTKWEVYPTDARPEGARVHLLNTFPSPKRLSFLIASRPVPLEQLKTYAERQPAEEDLWRFLMARLPQETMHFTDVPSDTPVWIHADLPDETKTLIAANTHGAIVVIAGRDISGKVVFEGCAVLTGQSDAVMLCSGHNRIADKIQ